MVVVCGYWLEEMAEIGYIGWLTTKRGFEHVGGLKDERQYISTMWLCGKVLFLFFFCWSCICFLGFFSMLQVLKRLVSTCFEHVHRKNHVMDYLVKQGALGEDDLVSNL